MSKTETTTTTDNSASIALVVALGKVWNKFKQVQSDAGKNSVDAFQSYLAMFLLQLLVLNKANTKSWLDDMVALATSEGGWSDGKRNHYLAFLNKFRKFLRNGQSGELVALLKKYLANYSDDDAKFEAIKAELVAMKITSYSKMNDYGKAPTEYTNDERSLAKTIIANVVANDMIANDETIIDNAVEKLLPMVRVWTKTLDNGSETTTVNNKAGQDSLADALAEAGHKRVA